MENKAITYKTLWVFALILSLGLIIAAAVMGYAFKQFNNSSNSIAIKGLAEKPIQADLVRWEISVETDEAFDTKTEAYQSLNRRVKTVQKFFTEHGFKTSDMQFGSQMSRSYYKDVYNEEQRRTISIFQGYTASRSLVLTTKDIKNVEKAVSDLYLLDENGVKISETPDYLVSNLEEIKMSLIANATKNAYNRANEFAKVGGAKVGQMRSARQGAFYILPESGSDEDSDYGGAYDKKTINKIARVVVTINYAIE